MPHGFYLRDYFGIDKGDAVTLPLPEQLRPIMSHLGALDRFDNGTLLLKQVVALNGDEVCRIDDEIKVNEKTIGFALEKSPVDGFPLPVWQGCKVLERDEVFVYTDYAPFSLDGRYTGPIKISNDVKSYKPLITW